MKVFYVVSVVRWHAKTQMIVSSTVFLCLRVGGWGPFFKEERFHDDLAMGSKRLVDLTESDMEPPQHSFFGQSVSLVDDTEALHRLLMNPCIPVFVLFSSMT